MFNWKIQKGWIEYERDYGLGKIVLTTCFLNTILLAIGLFLFGGIVYETLFPIILSLIFFLFRDRIVRLSPWWIFSINIIPVLATITLNYYIIGLFDQLSPFVRYDAFFEQFDLTLFNDHIAILIQSKSTFLGQTQFLYYDLLQISYMTYYAFPICGGIFYFIQLSKKNKYKISRFFISVVIYFNLNFLFYLLVPVSGPQYHSEAVKALVLPFSFVGTFINLVVADSHPNFIDCFPSGHVGISFLVTLWMFKIKHHYHYVFLFFAVMMMQATLALKYHYVLDVITAIPFAILCYKIAYKIIPTSYEVRENRKWRF